MKKLTCLLFLFICTHTINCSAQFEAPFDTTFSGLGYWMEFHSSILPGTITPNSITSIALQPDGKIVVAGPAIDSTGTDYFTVRRFNPDGSYDLSFGFNGKSEPAEFNYLPTENTFAHQVALYDDGRIVVAGISRNLGMQSWKYVMTRYTPDGMLDTTFGSGGKTSFLTSFDAIPYPPISIAVQDDGKVLEVTEAMYRLNRLEADGSIDSVIFFLSSYLFSPSKVLVDSIGKIYVAGGDSSGAQVYRLNNDLSMDATYSIDGRADYPFPGLEYKSKDMVMQPDGKILMAGFIYTNFPNSFPAVIRFNTDGSPDNTFGAGGLVQFPDDSDFVVQSIALLSDGKILITGQNDPDIYIKCLFPDGTPIPVIAGGMMRIIPPSTSPYFPGQFLKLNPNDILVQPDNKILIGGYGLYYDSTGSYYDWYLVRLDSNLSLDVDESSNEENNLLRIFPNPFQQSTTVNLSNDEGHLVRITISDISGRVVENFTTRKNFITIRRENKEPGMYFISAFQATGSRPLFGSFIIE